MRVVVRNILITGAMVMTGCGGGETPAPQERNAVIAADEELAALEAHGNIPVLDRSQSLAGPDQDQNGIRDDLDQIIQQMQLNHQQRRAVNELARSLQLIQTGLLSKEVAAKISRQTVNADMCFMNAFANPADGFKILKQIEGYTANTLARAKQYNHYNELRDGSVVRLPQKPACE